MRPDLYQPRARHRTGRNQRSRRLMKFRVGAISIIALSSALFAAETKEHALKRIDQAATVFQEINSAEDKGIPHDILERAQCVGIIPGMKRAGFIVGGNYGKGVVVCRT